MSASDLAYKIRSELRWVDSYLDNVPNSGYPEGDLEKAQQRLENARAAYAELKSIGPAGLEGDDLNNYSTFESVLSPNAEAKIKQVTHARGIQDLDRAVYDWERRMERAKYSNDSLQRFADDYKSTVAEFEGKWAGDAEAAPLIEKIRKILDDAYEAIDANERAAKEEVENRKREQIERAADDISYGDESIKLAYDANKCSFSATGESYIRQPWFGCEDCPSGFMMCVACVKTCHGPSGRFADHKVREYYQTSDMYCDCGHGDNGECECLGDPSATDKPHDSGHIAADDDEEEAEAQQDQTEGQTQEEPAPAASSGDNFATTKVPLPAVPNVTDGLTRSSKPSVSKPAWSLAIPSGAARRNLTQDQIYAIENFNSGVQYINDAFKDAFDYAGKLFNADENPDGLGDRLTSSLEDAEDRIKRQLGDSAKRSAADSKYAALTTEINNAVSFLRTYLLAVRKAWGDDAKRALGYGKVREKLSWYKQTLENADESAKQDYSGAGCYSSAFEELGEVEETARKYGLVHLVADLRPSLTQKNAQYVLAKFKANVAKLAEEEWIQYQLPGYVENLAKYNPDSPEHVEAKSILDAINEKENAAREAREKAANEEAANEQKAWDEMVARQKRELLEDYGNDGGSVTVGSRIFTFEGGNGNFVAGENKFAWNGLTLEVVDTPSFPNLRGEGMFTTGSPNRIKWTKGNRRLFAADYFAKDDGSMRFSPDHEFHPHIGDTRFDFNGHELTPNETYNWKFWNKIQVQGRVPPPLVMFAGLLEFLEYRCQVLSAQHICRSALFSEGTPARVCGDCKSSRCIVCRDGIAFTRDSNIAQIDKSCASFHGSNCARCGGFGANYQAYLCDGCLFDYRGYCCRNTRKL